MTAQVLLLQRHLVDQGRVVVGDGAHRLDTGVATISGAGASSSLAASSAPTAGSSQASQASGRSMSGCRSWMCASSSEAGRVMTVALTTQRSGSSSDFVGSFQNSYSPASATTSPSAGCR